MKISPVIDQSWHGILAPILESHRVEVAYWTVKADAEKHVIYPKKDDVWRAFNPCTAHNLKVIIVGKDPYHDGSANGLAFANDERRKISQSLSNIYKELEHEYGPGNKLDQTLMSWAEQGVLLLNRALTVRKGRPESHLDVWNSITQEILRLITLNIESPIVILLWGKKAQTIKPYCHPLSRHGSPRLILEAAHPSPFSFTKYLGCNHFTEANSWLAKQGNEPIQWLQINP